ncbi:MAG: methylated-DNA--[protein]-cysteine S-methyltransferase [Phycisphaerales bacterium]|jgi:O-6-methylguanine DNA methyltransferase|nr:methylated-DNA--[protein]-cysteine S-methyltransferase [Phycisphaerales bacterium]
MTQEWTRVETPVGAVIITADGPAVTVEFASLLDGPRTGTRRDDLLPGVTAWVRACLSGRVGPPPLSVPEGAPFQKACWEACRSIPVGETRTYSQLAAMAGRPTAARAAGSAMRNNPMALLTPCHRVVGASDLGGYSGVRSMDTPHLRLKSRILETEQKIASM